MTGLLLLLPLALMLPIGLTVLVVVLGSARPDHTLTRELASARRHGVVTGVLASSLLAACVLLAPVAAGSGIAVLGLDGATLAGVLPLLGATAALLVLLTGELTWPRPRGTTRTAVMHDRSLHLLLEGRWPRTAGLAGALLTLVALVAGWLGRAYDGRTIGTTTSAQGVVVSAQSAGPFPGWDYGLPQLAVLVVVLGLLFLVLRAATNRATVVAADLDTDRLLRRASAARAYRMVVFPTLLTAAADLVLGGGAGLRVFAAAADLAALGAVVLGLACGVAALVVVLVPAPRLPRSAQAPVRVGA